MEPKISEERNGGPRAMSVAQFCKRYGTGRTRTYEEIRAGRLRARKCGRRTIIGQDDAEGWLRSLPTVPTDPGA
jgi:excisionase family DNA binding protein